MNKESKKIHLFFAILSIILFRISTELFIQHQEHKISYLPFKRVNPQFSPILMSKEKK